MSSLAAARADGYYYPPEYDPSKGSLNKFNNSHGALGDRARKLDQGILIIRFEMPFNIWCAGCNHLIGKGVRFNAEKKQIGKYHSTKIWSFIMSAPCCKQKIEIHTDPKNAEYVVVSGAKKKVESYDADAAGTVELEDHNVREAKLADPLTRLEHAGEDARRARDRHDEISTLREESGARYKDDYAMNKALRAQMRGARKDEKGREARRKELNLPETVKLLPGTKTDDLLASATHFGGSAKFQQNWKHKRRSIASSSIFAPSAVAVATGKRSSGGIAKVVATTKTAGTKQDGGVSQHKRGRMDPSVKLRLSQPEGKSSKF